MSEIHHDSHSHSEHDGEPGSRSDIERGEEQVSQSVSGSGAGQGGGQSSQSGAERSGGRHGRESGGMRVAETLGRLWTAFTEKASDLWDLLWARIPVLLQAIGVRLAALGRKWLGWKRWQKVLSIVLAVLILLCAAAYAYFHSKYILMDISDGVFSSTEEYSEEDREQDELENEELQSRQEAGELEDMEAIESTGEVAEDEDVFNILLIGTDDRTVEFSDNARGDTCILVSINRETGEINLVSFERAIGVKIPYGEYEGQWDWLTHMFWYGGPDMMMQVIRENFKVDVTKYIRVNIRTFMKLVDAVGGVDIDMTEAEVDNINHPEGTYTADHIKALGVEDEVQQDLVVGVNHINGATAMLYARLRSIDDDWHRVVRQRNVILAAVESMKSMSLTDLDAMLNSVLPLVQTNLTEADIASLLTEVPTFLEMNYGSITFPLSNTYGLMDGMSGRRVLALDFETNAQELQNLLYGETTAEELTEKYENMEDELEDYSYRNSESYQENYADAESQVGYTTSSSSQNNDSADSSDTSGTETADLGVAESISINPDTGAVTIIYYNEATGERTAVTTGGTDETADTTGTTDTSAYTDLYGTTDTSAYTDTTGTTDTSAYTDIYETTDTSAYTDTTGTTDTSVYTDIYGTTDTSAYTDTTGTTDTSIYTDIYGTTDTSAYTDTTGTTDTSVYTDTTGTTDASVYADTGGTASEETQTLTGNAAAEAYAAALAAAAAAAAEAAGQ